jgi:hypothetical protein
LVLFFWSVWALFCFVYCCCFYRRFVAGAIEGEREREIDWLSLCALKRWWKPVRFVCFLVSPGKRSKLHCCVVFWIAVSQWKGALWSRLSLLAFAALSVYGFSFSSRFSLQSCFLLRQKSFWLEAADRPTQ